MPVDEEELAEGGARMASSSSERLAEAVAAAVLAKYAELPKNGKPNPAEWTILAGLVASRPQGDDVAVSVLALATGSKCLSASGLRSDGRALNDSHAEVLARRSFGSCERRVDCRLEAQQRDLVRCRLV